ncbi:MAG: hypothetical protein JXR91_03165 [Deltaproteobacteria bacterium]|nr:hypothetical protein [Deltaproteobacteria bacterium]
MLKKTSLFLGLIIVINIAMYAATLNYPLLWDDKKLIEKSISTAGLDKIPEAFKNDYLFGLSDKNEQVPYYRPINRAIIIIEKYLFQDFTPGYKAVNLFFQILTSLLIFIIARFFYEKILPEKNIKILNIASLFAALIFTTLPYNVDAVVFVTDLGDLMSISSILLILIFFQKYLDKGRLFYLFPITIFTITALGSKETSLAAAPLMILLAIFNINENTTIKRSLIPIIITIILTIMFLYIRSSVLKDSPEIDLTGLIFRFPEDLARSIRWAIAPHPLSLYENAPGTLFSIYWWAGVAVIITVTSLFFKYLKKMQLLLFLSITWIILITPSLVSNIFTHLFSLRYLFAPAASLSLAVGYMYIYTDNLLKKVIWLIPVTLLLLAIIRIDTWSSSDKLWSLQLERHPNDLIALMNFGAAQENRQNYGISKGAYLKGLSIAKKNNNDLFLFHFYNSMGNLEFRKYGNNELAIKYYFEALKFKNSSSVWFSIGTLNASTGQYEKALYAYKQAEKTTINSYKLSTNIAGALGGLHRFDEALKYIDKAIELSRDAPLEHEQAVKKREIILRFKTDFENKSTNR